VEEWRVHGRPAGSTNEIPHLDLFPLEPSGPA
jgi:hypothetical protein